MEDRELLELAAKALGFELHWQRTFSHVENIERIWPTLYGEDWDPLSEDGDALQLAAKCLIGIEHAGDYVVANSPQGDVHEDCNADRSAAIRRAIVRAAAEIGKATP